MCGFKGVVEVRSRRHGWGGKDGGKENVGTKAQQSNYNKNKLHHSGNDVT
jgi:hypothetical protein